ncbi:MAG: serine/threonine-protein kinase [Endomicrobiia bacterium]
MNIICKKCNNEVPLGNYCDLCGAKIDKNVFFQILSKETIISDNNIKNNKYDFVREIGRGAMGIVYEAINKEINKRVAIKKLKEDLSINPSIKESFIEEAKRVAKLNHQNIVSIYDLFEDGVSVCLVFEYIDGKTLEQVIREKKKIYYKDTIKIIKSVCEAIRYAHGQNIIHRDLKPSNIMVSNDMSIVKVMDFGIAREAKDATLWITGKDIKDTSGTIAYMSPEQHRGKFDTRSDIYSLGIIMYEMLTGVIPFSGADPYTQKERMIFDKPTEKEPTIPIKLEEIIIKCLQLEKIKRHQTVEELISDLSEIKI